MAWGNLWPHISQGSISEDEISDRGSEHDDDTDGSLTEILHVPTSFYYECFKRNVGEAPVMNIALVVS